MHHTATVLKIVHFYVNNNFFNDNCDILQHYFCAWKILVNYYLIDPQDFSWSFFTESYFFLIYHDISRNFSNVFFILEGSIFSYRKILLKESIFFARFSTIRA